MFVRFCVNQWKIQWENGTSQIILSIGNRFYVVFLCFISYKTIPTYNRTYLLRVLLTTLQSLFDATSGHERSLVYTQFHSIYLIFLFDMTLIISIIIFIITWDDVCVLGVWPTTTWRLCPRMCLKEWRPCPKCEYDLAFKYLVTFKMGIYS